MNSSILIVDDNIDFARSLAVNLERFGNRSHLARDYGSARAVLAKNIVDVILLDVLLGQQDGMQVLADILKLVPNAPVIMITGYTSIEGAVQAIRTGAYDYVQKPIQFDRLMKLLDNAVSHSKAKVENLCLRDRLAERAVQVTTLDPTMQSVIDKAHKLAASDLPILLCGENGTGKEVMADFIQVNSLRKSRIFIKVNCAAFPESLLDNELFGHEKGAFTGADTTFRGVFERASGGTLFLDEIGDMSPYIQAKILRVLQNSEFRRLGGSSSIDVDIRFISATNKDLGTMLSTGSFREDLFFRLSTATLQLPPLRNRKNDMPSLVDIFLREYSRQTAKPECRLSARALSLFLQYDWPGNIRELRNTLLYAATLTTDGTIDLDVLPPTLAGRVGQSTGKSLLEETEKSVLIQVLRKNQNNKMKAAQELKISRGTLYKKMTNYGIPR